jgi:hypothetical protein
MNITIAERMSFLIIDIATTEAEIGVACGTTYDALLDVYMTWNIESRTLSLDSSSDSERQRMATAIARDALVARQEMRYAEPGMFTAEEWDLKDGE